MDDPLFTSPNLSLVRAQKDDVPSIQSIINAAYSKYIPRMNKPPAPMTTDYQSLLVSSDHSIFILRPTDKEIVGALILCHKEKANEIQIDNVVVDSNAQGRGYGGLLMRYAEDFAKWRGCNALTLYTNVVMVENLGLYAKMGFIETGRRTEDGFERVYFRKELL
jgi:ribosomal protein S18 acetylase RimI-like enzyme